MAISIKVNNMENSKIIKADPGFILYNGAGIYAYEVSVPEGVIWEQVEDVGQLNLTENDTKNI